MNLIDPSGLLTEVFIWESSGHGRSAFGHASIAINETSYSFGPQGMFIEPKSDYLDRNKFRSAKGWTLQSITDEQETWLENWLKSYNKNCNFLTNS